MCIYAYIYICTTTTNNNNSNTNAERPGLASNATALSQKRIGWDTEDYHVM